MPKRRKNCSFREGPYKKARLKKDAEARKKRAEALAKGAEVSPLRHVLGDLPSSNSGGPDANSSEGSPFKDNPDQKCTPKK